MNYSIRLEDRKSKKGADYTVLLLKVKDYEKVVFLDKNESYILKALLTTQK